MSRRAAIAFSALALAGLAAGTMQVVEWWSAWTRNATDADIVGAWRATHGATVTFLPDHTFTAAAVPFQLDAPSLFDRPWSGAGSWRLADERGRQQYVQLLLETRTAMELEREWKKDRLRLFMWIGDPSEGKRLIFEKA